jgi:RNA polymerase sigma-32 factor
MLEQISSIWRHPEENGSNCRPRLCYGAQAMSKARSPTRPLAVPARNTKGKKATAALPAEAMSSDSDTDVLEPVIEPALEAVVDTDEELEAADKTNPELMAHEAHELADIETDQDEGDGDVLDLSGPGLVKRTAVALPEGEWVREDGPEPIAEVTAQEVSGGGADGLYRAFVRQATRVQRLSDDEERLLGLRVRDHQDKDAARKLVVHNLRLVIKMAHQYRRAWTNLMDLVQEASAGMAIASQRWDPDQGTRFGTYAVFWIRAQLTKFLMTNGRAIHTGNTRAGRKLYFQLPRVRRKLLAEGKQATIDEIAKEVQEDPEEVARVVARLDGREASLDQRVGDDEGGTLGEFIAGDEDDPEQNAARQEVSRVLREVMKRYEQSLTDARDHAIWVEHLTAAEPKSLVELGDRFDVSKQRMGQLATRIKRGFRRHVIDTLGPTTQLSWLFQTD